MEFLFLGFLWLFLAIFIEFKIILKIFIIYSIFFFLYCFIHIKKEFSNNNKTHLQTNDKDESIKNIAKTEMMSDMYRDITGKELDSIEKSLLFMHNNNKKKK